MRSIKLAILLITLAGLGHAEEANLRPDDVAVIKEALLHFASQTNYFNWASTDSPVLLVELWSRIKGKLVHTETNRVELLLVKSSMPTKTFNFFWGCDKNAYDNGYGDGGKKTTIQPSTLHSLLSRHEADLSALAAESPQFKMTDDTLLGNRTFADEYPKAKGWVQIGLPGYNATHDEALLGFMFGPRHSPSAALYKLSRTENGWKVTWFKLKYAP